MTSWEEHVAASDTEAPDCTCGDPQAHAVAALAEAGMPYLEACRVVWGSGPRNAAEYVRVGFALAFPWLRLPEEVA